MRHIIRYIPSFMLVGFLQVAPLVRLAQNSPALQASPFAVVVQWAAALAAVAGTMHAVSGASAAITGLTRYTNNTPLGSVTTNAIGAVGQGFRYRITVTGAGSDVNKDFFRCVPLPPGLGMNTNVGGNGFITNVPNSSLVPGVYPVTLHAGNTSWSATRTTTKDVTITIIGTGVAPTFTSSPPPGTGTVGVPYAFTCTASGDAPITFAVTAGALPGGLALSTAGAISGTPTVAGNFTGTITASNGTAPNATQAFSIVISPEVIPAPTISTHPTNVTALAGAGAQFSVAATGSGTLTYEWRHGPSPVPGGTNSVLVLPAVSDGDAGTYTVVVSNAGGSKTSDPAVLTVAHPPVLAAGGVVSGGGSASWTFGYDAHVSYVVEHSDGGPLGPWVSLTNFPAEPTGGSHVVTDSTTASPVRVYRVVSTLP